MVTQLRTEARMFDDATQGPGGYTSNQVAVATDAATDALTATCGS